MTGIPKPGEVDSANIRRPNVQQLPAEHQKILDDIQKKIKEEKEKEIQKLEEEAMKGVNIPLLIYELQHDLHPSYRN